MSQWPVKKQTKPFAFDGEYRESSSSSEPRGELVSFFDSEPVQTQVVRSTTDWTATRVTEEDLKEGMDDYKTSEEPASEDLKDLIASMPHNVARRGAH